RAVAAAFAHRRIDHDAARRILQRAALAAAGPFGRTGLHEYDRGSPLDLAAGLLNGIEFVAVRGLDAGRDVGGRIGLGIFRDQVDFADAFGVKLEGDLLRRQFAVDMLAAGHRGRVVIEDLVGDVGAGRDRLADREAAG